MVKRVITFITLFILVFTSTLASANEVIITDPTPDTTPPELSSFTISETQAAAGITIQFTAEATDDLSGVSTIYVSYRKPSGNTEGLYLYFNQSTNKFVGSMSFYDYSESGMWTLNYINVEDKKRNDVTYYDLSSSNTSEHKMDFRPYAIQVDGSEDSTPPVLNSISISTSQITSSGSVKIVADASDDSSGVNSYISVWFNKPSGRSINEYLHYNNNTGKFEGSLSIDKYDELGTWKLSSVRLQDRTGNSTYIYHSLTISDDTHKDFSNCSFNVSGTTPDLLESFLDSLAITLEGTTVKLYSTASDNLSGVSSVYANYQKPSGTTWNYYMGRNSSGQYVVSIPIDKYDELGTWKLRSITLYDAKGNYKTISDSSIGYYYNETRDFSPFHFTVRGVVTIPPPAPFSINIDPKSVTLNPGDTHQLNVKLNITDGTSKDITFESEGTTYTSPYSELKVDPNGLVTVNESAIPGVYYIQASNSGLTEQVEIIIPGELAPKSYLKITPLNISLSEGQSKQLQVIATTEDGTTKDVTFSDKAVYTSADQTIATVNERGLVQIPSGVKSGSVKLAVDYLDTKGEVTVNVIGPPTLKSIAMTPNNGEIIAGETMQLALRATMSDGSTKDITMGDKGTVYSTSDPSIAKVDSNGLISSSIDSTLGKVTITATYNGLKVQSIVTVKGPEIKSLTITPGKNITLNREGTQQLSVKALISDNTTRDVTTKSEGTTYTSTNTLRATVDENGKVTIPSDAPYGTVSIYVKNGNYQETVIITIEEDPSTILKDITVSPAGETVNSGDTLTIKVTGTYGDGSTKDLTAGSEGTTYTSTSTLRATVDANGKVTIPSNAPLGTVNIYVKNGSYQKTVVLTVEEGTGSDPTGLTVSPASETVNPGDTLTLKVTGTYGDGSTKDLTAGSEGTTYTSTSTLRATVDANGKVTIPSNASLGTVNIYVKNGSYQKTVTLTIAEDISNVLTSLSASAASTTVHRGDSFNLTVTGTYGDGSTKDLAAGSEGTTYTSTSTLRATVDANGKVTIPNSAPNGTVYIYVKNGTYQKRVILTIE
ncbi:Ig-like domain-containing protein [Bacillus sp. JJ634]